MWGTATGLEQSVKVLLGAACVLVATALALVGISAESSGSVELASRLQLVDLPGKLNGKKLSAGETMHSLLRKF